MKTLIYIRVSKKSQYPENQLNELREFCHKSGWEIVGVVEDHGVSGMKAKEKRKGLNEVFELASKRKFDILLVWALDRFSREGVLKTIMNIKLLDEYGVMFKSYTEAYLDTTGIFREVIISLLASIAKLESDRRSERIKAGLARTNKKSGRPKITEETIQKIKKLKRQGVSIREIAKKLNLAKDTVVKYQK